MLADPGGLVTRGWLSLRPADIEIETEIVVLSTFWPVRSMVLVRVGSVKLNGTLTPLAVNWPVPLARQYRLRCEEPAPGLLVVNAGDVLSRLSRDGDGERVAHGPCVEGGGRRDASVVRPVRRVVTGLDPDTHRRHVHRAERRAEATPRHNVVEIGERHRRRWHGRRWCSRRGRRRGRRRRCVVVVVVGGSRRRSVVVVVVGGRSSAARSSSVVVVVGGAVVVGGVVVGGVVVGGGVVGGAVGVHSSSDACADVAPSVTVTWQLLDWKLGASNRNLPSSSARLLADDSAEVTHTMASGTASSPSTLSRPSSSSARSTLIESSAFTGTTSSDADMPASATPTVISRAVSQQACSSLLLPRRTGALPWR